MNYIDKNIYEGYNVNKGVDWVKDYYRIVLKKSIILLILSFGLLFAVSTAFIWKYNLSIWFGVGISVFIVLIQFLLGPAVIGFVYGVLFENYDIYIEKDVLDFIKSCCDEHNIPYPKIGIIKDGNPNAFTYGHVPKNARLVLTTGILEMLDKEEQKAVIAHELGHIKHYDFIVMMMVSLIPMILYQIYIGTRRKKSDKKYFIGLGAYVAYLLSGFLVLGFSRLREYYSDNFSKEVMGGGEHLRNALIKIAYGTISKKEDETHQTSCMAFTNSVYSDSWMLSTYKLEDKSKIKLSLMRWDLKNPWGKWYEMNSTHPLTAKRILALDNMEIEDSKVGIKDFTKFLWEVTVNVLPYILALGSLLYITLNKNLISFIKEDSMIISLIGASLLLKYYYSYRRGYKERTIEQLLSMEDASPVKGIPAIIKGKIIGKGIPGLFYSEDLVIDDGTGIILVDYRQPLKIFEWIFGVFKVDKLIEKEVEIIGWYKRGMKPYFVCKYIVNDGEKKQCFNYLLMNICGYLLVILGLCVKFFG